MVGLTPLGSVQIMMLHQRLPRIRCGSGRFVDLERPVLMWGKEAQRTLQFPSHLTTTSPSLKKYQIYQIQSQIKQYCQTYPDPQSHQKLQLRFGFKWVQGDCISFRDDLWNLILILFVAFSDIKRQWKKGRFNHNNLSTDFPPVFKITNSFFNKILPIFILSSSSLFWKSFYSLLQMQERAVIGQYYLSLQKHCVEQMIQTPITPHSSPALSPPPPKYKRIKDYLYDMDAVLGKGNFSTVYRAVRQGTDEPFAVKVVQLASLTFKKLQELLEQEIAIMRSLDHPHVIRCVEVLKSANHCYFITELCDGGSLEKTLKQRGSLAEEELWPIANQLFQGLKYLSSRNIVHRDIKPANVFIKDGLLKVADFGFAIYASQSFSDFSIGSPLYMSPQGLLTNHYGPKTDVWAFGVVLYQLLHGKQPLLSCVSDEDLRAAISVNIRDEKFKEGLSLEVKDLIKRCLEVDAQKRITFEQMEKTAYFQRYLNIRSMVEIKIPNGARRPSMPILKNLPKMDTSLRSIETERPEKENNYNKENRENKDPRKQTLKFPTRIQKRKTRLCNIDIRQVEQNKSVFVEYNSRDLLKGDLMFNQAIGLIHYCRIGYKLAHEHLTDQLARCIKATVLAILKEMQSRTNLGQIKYDLEQNRPKKESKLKLVLSQYLIKYEKELKGNRTHASLPETLGRVEKLLQQAQKANIEQTDGSGVAKCYLTMLFVAFTEQLLKCIDRKSYKLFGEGSIDGCLDQKAIPKSIEEYGVAKRKYMLRVL